MPVTETYERLCNQHDDEEAWREARKAGIGASEMPALIVPTWRTPVDLYAEKLGLVPPQADNEKMRWGRKLEALVLEEFQESTGWKVERSGELLRSIEFPYLLATLDAWVDTPDGRFPADAKTTAAHNERDWEDGTPPPYIVIQVNQQMLVTGAERAYVPVLIGGQKFAWAVVLRDRGLQEIIKDAGRDFWNLIVNRIPPPVEGLATDALKRLYPRDAGNTVALDDSYIQTARDLIQAKEILKGHEAYLDTLEARVKAAMKDAQVAMLPDGSKFTWKSFDKSAYTVKAQTVRVFKYVAPKPEA